MKAQIKMLIAFILAFSNSTAYCADCSILTNLKAAATEQFTHQKMGRHSPDDDGYFNAVSLISGFECLIYYHQSDDGRKFVTYTCDLEATRGLDNTKTYVETFEKTADSFKLCCPGSENDSVKNHTSKYTSATTSRVSMDECLSHPKDEELEIYTSWSAPRLVMSIDFTTLVQ